MLGLGAVIAGLDWFKNGPNASFLSFDSLISVALQSAITAILATGATVVILGGGIDLSVGTLAGLCGALIAGTMPGLGTGGAIVVGLGVGLIAGLVNGGLIASINLPPFVATLGTMAIARTLTLVYTGGQPIANLTPAFRYLAAPGVFSHFDKGRDLWTGGPPVPTAVVLTLVLYFAFYVLLNRTAFGRYIYAIGGNEAAVLLSGVSVARTKVMVYGLAGLMAGLGGALMTARVESAQPDPGGGLELQAIAAVVIGGTSLSGGRGGIWGTLIGALTMGMLQKGLNILEINPFWQQGVVGMLVILAVSADLLRRRAEKRPEKIKATAQNELAETRKA